LPTVIFDVVVADVSQSVVDKNETGRERMTIPDVGDAIGKIFATESGMH